MKPDFEHCLELKKLVPIKIDKELGKSELNEALNDLRSAKREFQAKDWKWTTTKSYYAMFHAARALLYLQGLKERRSHFCIIEGIRRLYVEKGKLPLRFVEYLEAGKSRREDATYESTYSQEIAQTYLLAAEEFISQAKKFFEEC